MTMTCLQATELALGATDALADDCTRRRATVHVTQCPRCRAALAGQRALAGSLRAATPTSDERAHRAALARLGPALDRIDARRARRWWPRAATLIIPALAGAAALIGWLRAEPAVAIAVAPASLPSLVAAPAPPALVAPPSPARPPSPAQGFVLGAGERRAIALADDAGTHVLVIGPGRAEIVRAAPTGLELAVTDAMVIGEAGDAPLWIRGGGVTIRAQRARFAASMHGAVSVVVDKGVIDLDRGRLRAGQWRNRDDRAPALAQALGVRQGAPMPPRPEPVVARPETSAPSVVAITAAEMYAAAEAALDRGDVAGARLRLRTLVEEFPSAPQRATALYELARQAHRDGDLAGARAWLAMLTAGEPPAGLAELAAYLMCRLDVDSGDHAAARRCLTTFAATYPSSPHADAARAWGQPEESP
jgi:hypothetical protein